MTGQSVPAERDGTGARTDVDCSRRRVLAGSAAVLGTLGIAGTTGAGVAGAAGSQGDGPTVSVAFADDEVDAGDTTRLELVLSEVPEAGLKGWTFLVELTGSGSAGFTGEGEFSDSMALASIDTENTDSDSAAYLNGANAGGVQPGHEDLLIADVEVQGVEDGDVETDVEVQELSDDDSDPIDADVGTDSLTVVGSAPDLSLGDEGGDGDGDDEESDDGDGSSDLDPAPGDGDGSSGDGGSSGDDGSTDSDGDAGDDGAADDAGGADADDGDSVPGFGIGAAITAVLAGTAARVARGVGDDDGEPAR